MTEKARRRKVDDSIGMTVNNGIGTRRRAVLKSSSDQTLRRQEIL
jgi:hypothetical protein